MTEIKGKERMADSITVTISTVDGEARTIVYDQIKSVDITKHLAGEAFVPQHRCKIEFGFCSMRVEVREFGKENS